MPQYLQQYLRNFLTNSPSEAARQLLLKLLYKRKGMRFNGYRLFKNRYFIFNVDGTHLPTEVPYWNVTREQYRINCNRISLHACTLKEGDVVIDMGAGLGEETIVYAQQVGPSGKVVCLEPLPPVYEVLEEVVRLNGFRQVQLLPYALYESNGFISIVREEKSYESAHIAGKTQSGGFTVQSIRFDTLMQSLRLKKIQLLKVNIEGAERYLLNPGYLPYFQRIAHMAIACHDFRYHQEGNPFFRTREEVKQFFTTHGFTVHSQQTGEAFLDDWVYVKNPAFL